MDIEGKGFFCALKASQETLWTQRSLEDYCANLLKKVIFFFVFPCNGAPVD
jgi:hypothetical protein